MADNISCCAACANNTNQSTHQAVGRWKERTSSFPFDTKLLRGTVNPHLEIVEETEVGSDEHFADITKILREKIGLTENETTSCLLEIRRIMTGESVGSVVALEFHKNFLRSAPQKKRREKESRLDVSNGSILTESSYISAKKAAIEKNSGKAKGLRSRKRSIELVVESATDSEDESPTNQGYPCKATPKRQRKTAKQVAAEIANDVSAPPPNINSTADVPEGHVPKARAKRDKARAETARVPKKVPSASASKSKAKTTPLPKLKHKVSAVKSKSKNN
ncbi:hypothetical protein RvY_11540 [Ramazzottius varieornatus]|uniref:Uncharacterized protein n=1 Tax=Ramazzottius varieornatus TaxID=947166 RepID=A0A1D1VIV5_RAMVA|nr:hypothetical protein RvY_11540 [Ramazzottius varieornatus]